MDGLVVPEFVPVLEGDSEEVFFVDALELSRTVAETHVEVVGEESPVTDTCDDEDILSVGMFVALLLGEIDMEGDTVLDAELKNVREGKGEVELGGETVAEADGEREQPVEGLELADRHIDADDETDGVNRELGDVVPVAERLV